MAIKWINENPGAQPDERGYWKSADDRFCIWPSYRHTVYPDSYNVRDNTTKSATSYDRVRDCKWWAQNIIDRSNLTKGERL